MKIYTKTGDKGETSLLGGVRVSKGSPEISLLGAFDELSSHLGLVKAHLREQENKETVSAAQRMISKIMSRVADRNGSKYLIQSSDTEFLESEIDRLQDKTPAQKNFILPGECVLSAEIDVARTVCRRAESAAVRKSLLNAEEMGFINRLSDYLYALARYAEFSDKVERIVKESVNSETGTDKRMMNLETAKYIIEKTEQKASEIKLNAVIAVAGADGNVIAVHVMDGAFLVSFDVAVSKAYTSVALKMPTHKLAQLTEKGAMFHGLEEICTRKITAIGGGTPLFSGGTLIGAIGVSGGTDEEDIALSEFGAALLDGASRSF